MMRLEPQLCDGRDIRGAPCPRRASSGRSYSYLGRAWTSAAVCGVAQRVVPAFSECPGDGAPSRTKLVRSDDSTVLQWALQSWAVFLGATCTGPARMVRTLKDSGLATF